MTNSIIQFANKLLRGQGATSTMDDVHKFNGGVHPFGHKEESTICPIAKLAIPEKLILPLRQHIGHIPKIKVQVGDYVLKGQMLAEAEGTVSAAIHAPTSGTVTTIGEEIIPHPSGLPDMCITLAPDSKDSWIERQPIDWRNTPTRDLVSHLRLSGIVGLGGATFPTHVKVRPDGRSHIHTLVINAAECEPYITCDDMLMRERADEIVKGIEILQYILGAEKCIIGIEDNKPEATSAMRLACKVLTNIAVGVVPTLYPSGDARHLIHLLLGVEIPHDKRATELGIQVFNVATALAIYRYYTFGEPAISRIVTMTGNVASPQNFEVLFGTPLSSLVKAAGGTLEGTTHYIMGGPMMGFDLPSGDVPITKAANCIIAATPSLFPPAPPAMPCIRCARCAEACPVSLQPQELYWFAKSDNFEKARTYNLFDCIECGCCTYVCPSNIPLVQYYRYAKSEIIADNKAKEAANLARERNEFRLARIEREKLERAQKHAERAANAKKDDVNADVVKAETGPAGANITAADINAKKAAIAAAIERAKALKSAATEAEASANLSTEEGKKEQATKQAKPIDVQAENDKKALIAAAIARAKEQKLAAELAGATPKNTENVNDAVQAEINAIDTIREKAKQAIDAKEPDTTL